MESAHLGRDGTATARCYYSGRASPSSSASGPVLTGGRRPAPRAADAAGLRELLQPAAARLAAADDVEAEGVEAGEVGVGEDEGDVVLGQRLPLVQADEDVAAADAGLGGGAVGVHGGHLQ